MEEITAIKLKNAGVLEGYNGFAYLVWVLEHYNAYSVADLSMDELVPKVAKKFGVSEKAVMHNLTLLLEKSWNSGKDSILKKTFGFCDYMPTLKEFIATLIVITEYSA